MSPEGAAYHSPGRKGERGSERKARIVSWLVLERLLAGQ
jgi:hypothetical protein